jgi:hypothetical protein
MTAAAEFGSSPLAAFARAVGLIALAVGSALALIFAFAAALVVGLMVFGAAVVMRLMPRRKRGARSREDILDARSTPSGWVVETATQRRA